MAILVVAHGAWSGGWSWKKMRPLALAAGHTLVTPTYSGLGERSHLSCPSIDLNTHVSDVTGVIETEDLRDVMLIGHSYGGMVATAVADRLSDRISKLVYLDAFVPRDGQCLYDLLSTDARARSWQLAAEQGEGWRVPPNPLPPDTPESDLPWLLPRRLPQPILTFQQPVRLKSQPINARHYICCKRAGEGDVFRQFAARAQQERWGYDELDASHSPHITAPEALAAVLHRIAAS